MLIRIPQNSRSFVAAVLSLLIVLATAVSSFGAGEQEKLDATRRQIAEIKKRLAAAKGQAAAIEKEIDSLDEHIGSLNRQIEKGEHDVSELQSQARTATAQIEELEVKYERAANAANERAKNLYKQGPGDTLSQFLSVESPLEFTRLQYWWEKRSEIDSKTIIDTARLKSEVAERRADLDGIINDLNASRKWVESKKKLAEEARAGKNSALNEVEKNIAHEEQHIKELEADSRRLTGVLQRSASKSSGPAIDSASGQGFSWPVRGRVTSNYGPRRGRMHTGIDIDGNTGDPIRAAKAGSVVSFSCGSGYGVCIVIDHGGGVSTLYAHLSRRSVGSGSVARGETIGYVGCTGSCTGSHLHLEFRVNGSPRNPRQFLP